VIAVGVSSIVRGIRRTFLEEVRPLVGPRRRIVQTLGVAGHVSRGLALTTIGVLVLIAAVSDNPSQVGGLDHALRYLASCGAESPAESRKPPANRGFLCGPYRARTDDIHGVNVALYQLS
jgi:hypothetical protein